MTINLEAKLNSRYFPFVSEGIDKDKVDSAYGLSMNFFWILRFGLIMICISGFQMVPVLQVFCIVAIDVAFFVYFCKALWKEKIFLAGCEKWSGLVTEICILIFLIVTVIFLTNDLFSWLSSGLFFTLQIICIVCIFLTVLVEFVTVLYSMITNTRVRFRLFAKVGLGTGNKAKELDGEEKKQLSDAHKVDLDDAPKMKKK